MPPGPRISRVPVACLEEGESAVEPSPLADENQPEVVVGIVPTGFDVDCSEAAGLGLVKATQLNERKAEVVVAQVADLLVQWRLGNYLPIVGNGALPVLLVFIENAKHKVRTGEIVGLLWVCQQRLSFLALQDATLFLCHGGQLLRSQ